MSTHKPEPVAWMVYSLDGKSVCVTDNPSDFTSKHRALPLYSAPPQRKPLSSDKDRPDQNATFVEGYGYVHTAAVRAIERAHGITGEKT